MSTKSTFIWNSSAGPMSLKYIEREQDFFTERYVTPVKAKENNVTGSFAHLNSELRINNESAYCRSAHADVFVDGRDKKVVPLSSDDTVVVTANKPVSVDEEPVTIVPMDDSVSSVGFNGTHLSVDQGAAVAFLPENTGSVLTSS